MGGLRVVALLQILRENRPKCCKLFIFHNLHSRLLKGFHFSLAQCAKRQTLRQWDDGLNLALREAGLVAEQGVAIFFAGVGGIETRNG